MRITLTLFVLAIATWSHAQVEPLVPCGQIIPLQRPSSNVAGGQRDILFSEDFAGGIPADWINEEAGGFAHWQYRGLNSTPSLEVGTQGSCLPEGVIGDPIQSPTQGNGFVIFDSNWWDNPNSPCTEANMGSGSAPGPHFATLTSPVIDLTNQFSVALEFNQYYKGYQTTTSVEVSTDGGNFFFEVYNNNALVNPTPSNNQVFIPIGAWAGGLPEVRFRFVFSGQYYFWQLDDVKLVTMESFDMSIQQPTYGDFDISDPAHPTGFEFMEYSSYPVAMAPYLKFSALAVNNGIFENGDVRLHVDITDQANALVHTAQSDEGFYVWPGTPQEVRAGQFQMPNTLGDYQVQQYVTGLNGEIDTDNNHDTAHFVIHPYQMARDRMAAQSIFYPTPNFFDNPLEIGNVFLITADDMDLYSLSVGLGVGTALPTTMYGALYEIDLGKTLETTLLATTATYDVTADMLNNYNDNLMTTLSFGSPVSLVNGKAYLAMLGSLDGGNHTVCALSGISPAYTSWVNYGNGQFYLINQTPMVRMNFDDFDAVSETARTVQPPVLYPNPSSSAIHFKTERSFDKLPFAIYNMLGERVYNGVASYPTTTVNVSSLAPGTYQLRLDQISLRFIKE